jgi:hypothetical protein
VWYRVNRTDDPDHRYKRGYGVSLDQKLSSPFTLFGRFGASQTDAKQDYFYSAGFQLANGAVISPGDTWGAGYAHVDLGSGDKERLVEGYYNFSLTERLRLSFHLSHVLEKPAGGETLGFLVPGIRFQASF